MFGLFKKNTDVKTPAPAQKNQALVVPVIRTVAYIAAARQRVESSFPAGPRRDEQMPICTPLVGDLAVAYTSDLQDFAKLVAPQNLSKFEVTGDNLHAFCMGNLRWLLKGRLSISQIGDLLGIGGLNGLEASTLLATEIWDKLSSDFQGEVIATVPSDLVVLAYVEPSASATADRRTLGQRAKASFLKEGATAWKSVPKDKALSAQYFAWRNQKWVVAGSFA